MEILSTWALVNNNFDWMDEAACYQSDVDFIEPARGRPTKELSEAQKICSTCPVKQDCLKFALDNKFAFGIWGGATPTQRCKMLGIKEFY